MIWRFFFPLLSGILALVGTACDGASSTQQTLSASNATLGTEAMLLYSTATVNAARLRVTQDFAAQEVARLNTQQARIIATMVDRGIRVDNLPGASTAPPATQTADAQSAPRIGVTPLVPTSPPVQVTRVTTPASTPIGNGPALINVVTAQGVLDNDCASSAVTQFASSTGEIYVVATALNIPNGTSIGSRWLRDGSELWSFSLEFGFIDEACIWFFATQEDFPFVPGPYSVQLDINGQVVAQTDFTITDGVPIGGDVPPGQ